MKRVRIGDVDIDITAPYWSDGRNDAQLRKSQILQFAKIDCANSELNLLTDEQDAERQGYYNQMDLAFAIVRIIDAYGGQKELLRNAGAITSIYIENGEFGKLYDSMEARNKDLNRKIANIQAGVENYQGEEFANEEFAKEWEEKVIGYDYYCDPRTGERSNNIIEDYAVICGGYDYSYYSAKIKEAGAHWLYATAKNLSNDEGVILPNVAKKRARQMRQASWFESANTGLSSDAIYSLSRSNVCGRGCTPEQAIDTLKYGNGSRNKLEETKRTGQTQGAGIEYVGIGEPISIATITLITTIISLISALAGMAVAIVQVVFAIKNAVRGSNTNAYANAPTEEDLKLATAEIEDWNGFLKEQDSPLENIGANIADGARALFKSPIAWLVMGIGAIFIFSRNK